MKLGELVDRLRKLVEPAGSILSDTAILRELKAGRIVIDPFEPSQLGTNSYDVRLSSHLAVYEDSELDARYDNRVRRLIIPEDGFVLRPGEFYLGSTVEYTESNAHVPFLEGKSSTGRLGIKIHDTAGKGDVGFRNHWTLEITCTKPVRVYPGMPIGQIIFFTVEGRVKTPYYAKRSAKYSKERDPMPVRSMMWKNFP